MCGTPLPLPLPLGRGIEIRVVAIITEELATVVGVTMGGGVVVVLARTGTEVVTVCAGEVIGT